MALSKIIKGTKDDDNLLGTNSDDLFIDQAGNDVMTGYYGADTFAFNLTYGGPQQTDTITDYDPSVDELYIYGIWENHSAQVVDSGILVSVTTQHPDAEGPHQILLEGLGAEDLNAVLSSMSFDF